VSDSECEKLWFVFLFLVYHKHEEDSVLRLLVVCRSWKNLLRR